MNIPMDELRNSLNEKRREKEDQFLLSLFNAAIMFLSIATPLFMTSGQWTCARKMCVQISIICMFVVVVSLLFVLRRLIRFYKGVVVSMANFLNSNDNTGMSTTSEWTWYERWLSRIANVCFVAGIIFVFVSVFI